MGSVLMVLDVLSRLAGDLWDAFFYISLIPSSALHGLLVLLVCCFYWFFPSHLFVIIFSSFPFPFCPIFIVQGWRPRESRGVGSFFSISRCRCGFFGRERIVSLG